VERLALIFDISFPIEAGLYVNGDGESFKRVVLPFTS
jgi:hypothetical protein